MARKMLPQRSTLATLAVVFFLSACAIDPSTILRTARVPEAADAPSNANDPNSKAPGAATQEEGLPPEITDAVQNPEQVAAVEIDLTNFKERQLGLDDTEITELLGKPTFDRNEPPARIWQFQSDVCFVDLFLFSQEGDLTVDHVEVRGKKVEKIDEKICFASILKAANGGEGTPVPVGPLQPAPGAVKVAPVKQSDPSSEDGEELAPPSLIQEDPDSPEIPAFGEEEPPADAPKAIPGEKAPSDEEPEIPSFGSEDPPQDDPAKEEPEIPSFGSEDPPKGAPTEEEPKMPSFGPDEPTDTPTGKPEKITGDEEDEPEVEFKMTPAPKKEAAPEPVPEPEEKIKPEPEPVPEPEEAPSVEEEEPVELDEPEGPQPEEQKPEEPEPEDQGPEEQEPEEQKTEESDEPENLESNEEEENTDPDGDNLDSDSLDNGAPEGEFGIESEELPNAPKLGTQTESDLLEQPAP